MSAVTYTQLAHTPSALGVLAAFLASHPPFNDYEFGVMVKTLEYQLINRTHVLGTIERRVVAYVGWLKTTRAIAEAWAEGRGPLNPREEGADAAAVTVLAIETPDLILPLIREAKRYNLANSVFWKRDFLDGRPARKRAVKKKATA